MALSTLKIIDEGLAKRTVSLFKEKNIDIIDAYFASLMEGEKINKVFSFDHDLDKIPGLKHLEKI